MRFYDDDDDDDDDVVGDVAAQIDWLHEFNHITCALFASLRRGLTLWSKAERDTPEYLANCALTRASTGKDHVGVIADLEHRIRTGGRVDHHLVTGRPVRYRRKELVDQRYLDTLRKSLLRQQVRYSGKAEGEAKYQKRRKARKPQGDA